ncbi:HNH endonuclease [Sporosarcina sp. FSL K6-1540]|uniref:HNH endonuclease n=1 Tax=Sporosarcina sp. FSL K6-1540 TaxID=2921555 RepID=UPI00315ACD78
MNIEMDLSEVLLYLDLLKKQNRKPSTEELKMMLYYLKNYEEVKEFCNKLEKLKFNPSFKFYTGSLIFFIEDYDDCINLKNKILQTTRRKYSILFRHQILLANTEAQAASIVNEAKVNGITLDKIWSTRFNSIGQIKSDQQAWREIRNYEYKMFFPNIYNDYYILRLKYFESISLKYLKEKIINLEAKENNSLTTTQTSAYTRSVYIREFARRVSNGICQLCDMNAPFLDKQGEPFLEVHHIHYLSKGGSDTTNNVVALCPNCHRKIHHLEIEADVIKISERAINNISINNVPI